MEQYKTPHTQPYPDNLQQHLSAGEKRYNPFCGTCHQKDGLGAPGRFPPLLSTGWVLEDKQKLIELTLYGLQGGIEVQGDTCNGVMPPHNFLPYDDIARILPISVGVGEITLQTYPRMKFLP